MEREREPEGTWHPLLHSHRDIIYEEVGGRLIRRVGSLEVQRDQLPFVCRQGSCNIKGILYPGVGGIAIAARLQGTYRSLAGCPQASGKSIRTLLRCLIVMGPVPVGHDDFCGTGRDGEGLPDTILAAGITTQVGAITPRMRVQIVDQLIAARGGFLPGRLPFLKSTILYQRRGRRRRCGRRGGGRGNRWGRRGRRGLRMRRGRRGGRRVLPWWRGGAQRTPAPGQGM